MALTPFPGEPFTIEIDGKRAVVQFTSRTSISWGRWAMPTPPYKRNKRRYGR